MFEYYKDKANRDKRAKELTANGFIVMRRSAHNQLLHPMYLEDVKASVRNEDKGFGNTIYKTYFATVYEVNWS